MVPELLIPLPRIKLLAEEGSERVSTRSSAAAGLPIFALSQLSSHTRDLLKNKRASLFCAESGGMRPDAARATLVGSVEKIEDEIISKSEHVNQDTKSAN